MKVPAVGRVRPSSTPLGYLRSAATPRAFGAGVAESLRGLGANVSDLDARMTERKDKVSRFDTLRKFGEFEIAAATAMEELKRNAPANAQDFVNQADSVYARLENEFISKQVPGDLQDEFRFRTGQVRQRIVADSLNFQYTQQDEFFRKGIEEIYIQAQNGVAQAPDQIGVWADRVGEAIESSDLMANEKAELASKVRAGLTAVVYKSEVERIAENDAAFAAGGIQGFVDQVVGVESGGNATAKNPRSSAQGAGQFITSTWNEFIAERHPDLIGTGLDSRNDPQLSREAVAWYAEKNSVALQGAGLPVNAGTLYLAHFAGPAGAIALLNAESVATAKSVLGEAVVNANPFLKGKSAAWVVNWANEKMGGVGSLEDLRADPFFDEVPLDTRLTLENAALQNVQERQNERERLFKEQQKAAVNSLFVGLIDGTANAADTAALREAGILTDADDILKAERLLEERQALNRDREYIAGLLADPNGGSLYNPAVDDGALNKYIGDEGLARIGSMDQAYMDEGVIPAVEKFQDIPTNVVGQLEGMSRSNDPNAMRFAYSNLALLRERSPEAFTRRTVESLAAKVDMYTDMRGSATEEELFNYLRGGRTPAEISANRQIDEEANALLGKMDVGNLASDIEWGRDDIGNYTAMQVELESEYVNAFRFHFRATRDEEKAQLAATRQLQRVFGSSTLGGRGAVLTRYPIEKYYPAEPSAAYFNFPPDWRVGDLEGQGMFGRTTGFEAYDADIKAGLGMTDEESYQLIGDDITRRELQLYQSGQSTMLPSYRVIKYTANGDPVIIERRWDGTGVVNAVPRE